jgi:hypothetical protein
MNKGGRGGLVFYQVFLLSKSQVQALESKKTEGGEQHPLVEVTADSMEENS